MELNQDFSGLFNSNSSGAGQKPTAAPTTPSAAPSGLTQDFSSVFAPQQTPQTTTPANTAKLDDVLSSEGATALKPLVSAFYGQESSSGANPKTSVDGAIGPMQIEAATGAPYLKPGENLQTNGLAVGTRILADYAKRYDGDPAKIAVAYFSGPGNVATSGPTPWKQDKADGNGTTVSQYVKGILTKLGSAAPVTQPAAAAPAPQAQPDQPAAPDLSQAPKWSDVVANPQFQKLDPATQQQTADAYFAKWIAPNTPADQLPAAQAEWAEKSTAAAKQATPPSLLSRIGSGITSAATSLVNNGFATDGTTPDNPVAQNAAVAQAPQAPNTAGVLGVNNTPTAVAAAQKNLPPLPSMASPSMQQQVFQQFDAASPDQRQQMMQQPGVAGQLAQYRAAQYQNNTNPVSSDIGTSIEDRAQRLMNAGVDPAVARAHAQRDAASGAQTMIPGDMKATDFDFDTAARYRNANPIVRGAVQGVAGSAQSLVGIGRFVTDMTGAGNSDVADWLGNASKNISATSNAIGTSANPLARNLEAATSGLVQAVPAMLGAAAVPEAAALPLAQNGLQMFGQSYAEGRDAGQDPAQATTRAGMMGAFAVLGHALGLDSKLDAIRQSVAGASTDAIGTSLWNATIRDLPSTQAMALGNFITDKLPGGVGLTPEAKFTDWLQQAGDMFVQTAMMNGMLGAGAVGSAPLARTLRGEVKPTFDESSGVISDKNGNYWQTAPNTPAAPALGAPGTSANAPHPSQVAADNAVREIAAAHGMDASALIPEPTAVPQPAAAPAAEAQPQVTPQPGQPLVWRNADTDIPVVYRGVAPDRGPDGRLYAQVEHNGTQSFVPFDELAPAAQTPPVSPSNDATAAPAPSADQNQQILEFAAQRRDALQAKQNGSLTPTLTPEGHEDVEQPGQQLTPTERAEWDMLTKHANDPATIAQFYGLNDDEPAPVGEPAMPTPEQVDAAAHQAATSPKNDLPEPTQAQKEAGNYTKGHVDIHGLDVSIENPQGSTRSGTDPDGVLWENKLQDHYGYIRRTVGADDEHIDTFVGPNPASRKVFIVDQTAPDTGKFDEHKVMLSYDSMADADAAYHRNYMDGWNGRGAISELPIGMFKEWLANGDTKAPFAKGVPTAVRSAGPATPPKTEREARARKQEKADGTTQAQDGAGAREAQTEGADRPVAGTESSAGDSAAAAGTERGTGGRSAGDTARAGSRVQPGTTGSGRDAVAGDVTEAARPAVLDMAQRAMTERDKRQHRALADDITKAAAGDSAALERVAKAADAIRYDEIKPKLDAFVRRATPADPVGPVVDEAPKAEPAPQARPKRPKTEKQAKAQREQTKAANDAYGANNKTFTADAAAKARETLRQKLGQLNSGVDPEMLHAGMMLAGFHIEAGARKFSEFAKAMVGDIGENIRPYLRSFYESVRHYPGFDAEGMSTPDEIAHGETEAKEPAEAIAHATDAGSSLVDHFYSEMTAGRLPKDNVELRKAVSAFDGKPADNTRLKQAQEDLEAAIAHRARDIVAQGKDDRGTFESLVSLYENQPNLNIRTSTSIENQAYSTPAPLAYVAARLAGIGHDTTVYEPTAGNGMLLLTADPKHVTANELEDQRFANLKAQGFDAIQGDALQAVESGAVVPGSQDAVITNPPFGSVKDEAGKATKVAVDGYKIGKIDHLIAAEALRAMKDDGKATLILGADKRAGGLGTDDRIFFNWLYGNYHVVSHFEVDGKLYSRQGASWPVRVITLDGRMKSKAVSPREGTIARVDNWNDVYEQYRNALVAENADAENGQVSPVGAGEPAPVDDAKPADVVAGKQAATADRSEPAGSAERDGNVRGRGARAVDNQPAAPDAGLAGADRAQRGNDEAARPDQLADGSRAGSEPAAARDAGSEVTARDDRLTAKADDAKLTNNDPDNQFQTKYVPRSWRKDEGVLIPVNMAGPTQDALNRLEDEVGNIDAYAARELGYDSPAQLHDALMGLQVDSVASAIHQIGQGKGTIIADQTGIGKGRQAASVIRWAARKGHIPVFVTVKPQLFTDMYGDLADIGTHDVNPFIMNSDAWISGPGGEKLFANKSSGHRKTIENIAANGVLPDGTNAVFMTYSQINTENRQRAAIMALADKAVFVLDESHNAGGASSTGEFVKGALDAARGAVYLSATYAKRPDTMPVYFKTDIGEAISDDDSLMQAMAAGGLPLQTVVANNLVKAGQMFRRERSYDGVSIATDIDTARRADHEKLSDHVTEALRAIVDADKAFHNGHVETMKQEAAAEGAAIHDIAGNQASSGVNHTEFSSVVHNFVRQMLLGLKADAAADKAIEALKAGEKPLIAVENTMGSFLSEYADNNGIKLGDPLGKFDYRTVLSRALERTRYVVVQLPNGEKEKRFIPLDALDAGTRAAYTDAQHTIDALKLDIPVSPIDWMRHRLEQAGHSVAEITGRNLAVDYSGARPTLAQIPAEEQTDKVGTTRRFNDGSLDALILNVAGSTGISLHASEKFRDQRVRHMVVAQPAQDINIFMQMLGRIHRTGQVVLPKYTILNVDLPAEKRPTALLSKKMKSLNANTSSNTESATSIKAPDMLNQYGDQVIGQYLEDNPELRQRLGVDGLDSEGNAQQDLARKATGRLALMPVETQHAFYNEVQSQYETLIDYLNRTNQNDLEPRTFDYDAKETRAELLHQGDKPQTPFGEDAYYGEYSIKAQGKPMTPDEIMAEAKSNLDGQTPQAHADALIAKLHKAFEEGVQRDRERNGLGATFDEDRYRKALKATNVEPATAARMVEEQKRHYQQHGMPAAFNAEQAGAMGVTADKATAFIRDHRIGTLWRVEINGELYNAAVTDLKSTHKASGNPFSMSKLQVSLALNGSLRHVTLPATQFHRIEVSPLRGKPDDLFRVRPGNERETAKIVTGNLLAAYGEMQGSKGTIIHFTKSDGSTEQGILLPKKFSFEANVRGDYRLRSGSDALQFLLKSESDDIARFGIASRDGAVRVKPQGRGVVIQVPKSKAKGGKYFLDRAITATTGDFVSSSKWMEAFVPADKAEAAIDAVMNKSALYALPSMADEARTIVGDPKPSIDKADAAPALAEHRDLNDATGFARESALSARPEPDRISALTTLRRLSRRLDAGEITDSEFRLGAQNLLSKLEDKRDGQLDRKADRTRVRGDLYIRERLLRAERQGDITHAGSQFAQWLLDQNPAIADDLGIGVRGAKDGEGGTAGMYNSINRVVTLISGNTNDGTAVHEILHHTERMMPADIRSAIYKAWSRDWQDAYRNATPEQKPLFAAMLKAAVGSQAAWAEVAKGFRDGILKYDEHYKLVNPSEYWAVKATDLMKSRYEAKGWIARAKQWLKEMIEKVKGLFGLSSDAPIIKGMESVLKGDGEFTTDRMMAEKAPAESRDTTADEAALHAIFHDLSKTPTERADDSYERAKTIIDKSFDTKSTARSWNAVSRTFESQVSKALKSPEYMRVFDAMRRMMNHTGLAATRAAELAPQVLPNSNSLRHNVKTLFAGPRQIAEMQGATRALLDGTLAGTSVLEGRTWSDSELRQIYGLSNKGVEIYRQTRAAIDASLDEVSAAEAWSMSHGFAPAGVRDQIVNDPTSAQRLIRNSLDAKIEMFQKAHDRSVKAGDMQKAEILHSLMMPYVETRKKIDDIFEKAEMLKSAGYVPLMRFGKYTVYAHKIDPETGLSARDDATDQPLVHYFGMFATEAEAKAEHERQVALYKDDPTVQISRGVKSEKSHQLYDGLSPETLSLFADKVGADDAMKTVIQLALSERSALKRRLNRRAITGYSDDMPRILSNFLTSNGRFASQRMFMRDVNRAIQEIPKEKGDVMDEAIKLKQFVLNGEDPGSRTMASMFLWTMAGSPTSAAVIAMEPFQKILPYLSQFGIGRAMASVGKAVAAVAGQRQITDPELRAALQRADREGLLHPQQIFHLYDMGMANMGTWLSSQLAAHSGPGASLTKGAADQIRARARAMTTMLGIMHSAAESFGRNVAFHAAWHVAKARNEKDPYAWAARAIDEAGSQHGKINRSNFERTYAGRLMVAYRNFTFGWLGLLFRMARKGGVEGARGVAVMLAMQMALGGLVGLPFMKNLDDLVDTIGNFMGHNTDFARIKRQWAEHSFGKTIGDLFMHGFARHLPVDLSEHFGMGDIIPGTDLLKAENAKDKARNVLNVLGPQMQLITRAMDAYDAAASGNWVKAGLSMAPNFVKRPAQGLGMLASGQTTDMSGRKVADASAGDAISKIMGGASAKTNEQMEIRNEIKQEVATVQDKQSQIINMWARGIADDKPDVVQKARDTLTDWNAKNPDSLIVVTPQALTAQVKQMRLDANTRAIMSAPKGVKGDAVSTLREQEDTTE